MTVTVPPHQITSFLKRTLQYRAVIDGWISQQVILQTVKQHSIQVTEIEVQAQSDYKRSQLRLERAADTINWLQQQGLTSDDWRANIETELQLKKLKSLLFEQHIESIFYQKQLEFESILLYQLVVPYSALASELFYQIEEEEISFYEAAHLYDIDEVRRNRCGYEGILRRRDLPPSIAAVAFSGHPGVIKPPFQTEQGFHILLPEKYFKPELTPDIRDSILEQLFQEWLQRETVHFQHNSAGVTQTDES